MPFLILFAVSWLAFLAFADKTRWRQLLPASMLAMLMSLSSDMLINSYPLWVYHDRTELLSSGQVRLLDDWGIYPVAAYLFLQYYPHEKQLGRKLGYFAMWTTGVILLEALFCRMGWMKHQLWWSLGCSYGADWLIFFLLLCFAKRFHKTDPAETTAPGPTRELEPAYLDILRQNGVELHTVLQNDNLEIALLEIKPGGSMPTHSHEDDQVSLLVQGEMVLEVGSLPCLLKPGMIVSVDHNLDHSVRNTSMETVIVLSVFTPVESQNKWGHYTLEQLQSMTHAMSI